MNVMKQNNYSIPKTCFTIYTDVLTDEECDSVCEQQIDKEIIADDQESINSNFLNGKGLFSYEKCVLDNSEDLEQKLIPYIFDCNSKIYGYEIWGIEEDIKLLTFKSNDFINKHERTLWYSSEPNDRKLSCYLFLSNTASYTGGKIKIDESMDVKSLSSGYNRKGNLLVFPSFVSLEIEPVTSGFMQLLTFDIIGPNLR